MTEVAGLLVSPLLKVFFEKMASGEFVDFFRRRKLDDVLLKKLETKLLAVNAVLEDAEEKQVTSSTVKKWLDELKDAIYEAEDILDAIDTEALSCKLDSEFQTTGSKVRKSISTSLNPFAKKIEPKIKEVLERLDNLVTQKDVIGLKESVGEKSSARLPTTSLVEESGIFGRVDDKEAIIKLLLSEEVSVNGLCVITIVGMGGVGKTTLPQLVYDDKRVKEIFDLKVWVCVSNEFDVLKITKTILERVGLAIDGDRKDLDWLQDTLKEKLRGKKFLFVLDDVWNENYLDWETLSTPFKYGVQGSRVIVTTRGEHVALAMHSNSTYRLKQLPEEDCWSLFAQNAFREGESRAQPELEGIAKQIAKKCNGLPLAAKTIGALLWSKLDIDEWDRILKSELWDLPIDIIPALRLSYKYLPSHLKRCFAYCSIFPQDYVFKKDELVFLWMAEGLLQQSKDRTLEQVGSDYFLELEARSLFQRSSNDFVMHDLVNDLARFVSGGLSFRLEAGDDSYEMGNKTRHFSTFGSSLYNRKKFEMLYKAKGLRTFLPIVNKSGFGIQTYPIITKELTHELLPMLRCLRVLSLYNWENVTELPDSISKIKHLRYLDLSCTPIRMLPISLCKLCNLQTLKLSYCRYLSMLPRDMHKLINLRYLYLERTPIKEMPIQMGRLKSLQTLTKFIVSNHSGSGIGELGKLTSLRGKLSISELQNIGSPVDALDASLKNIKYLEMLKLEWKADSNISESRSIAVLDSLQPPANLKELTIKYYGGRSFPYWVGQSSLSKITYLSLSNCKSCHVLPPIGQQPSLEHLEIDGFNAIVTVGPEFYGIGCSPIKPFVALKSLWFTNMPEWEKWMSCFGAESEDAAFFTNLEDFGISNCPKLTGALPIHLPSLVGLWILDCPMLTGALPIHLPSLAHLEIRNCPRLVGSLPALALRRLELRNCNGVRLQELPTELEELTIDGDDVLAGIINYNGCLLSTLKYLHISNFSKLEFPIHFSFPSLQSLWLINSCDSLRSLPLDFISKINYITITGCRNLESLEQHHEHNLVAARIKIEDCPNLVSFPNGGLRAPTLTTFDIRSCPSLKSLPYKMHILLPSLQNLEIRDCPEIESFPEGGLPSTLFVMGIFNCDKLVASRMGWGLQKLTSLEAFRIEGKSEDVKSFTEEGLLPNSLRYLEVSGFPNMESLDNKDLQHLTPLVQLVIFRCPKFQFQSEERLPPSLRRLLIQDCPSLKKQLRRKKGKEWKKISHVPWMEIDGESI